MHEIKTILENLNSALSELQNKTADVDKERNILKLEKIKLEELSAILNKKSKDLNDRENKIKNIESIVEFSSQAKKTMQEAIELKNICDARYLELESDRKKLNQDKALFEKEKEDKSILEKKQIQALKNERKELEKEKQEFEIRKKIEESR